MGFWNSLKEQLSQISLTYLGGHPELKGPLNVGVISKDNSICICRGTNVILSISKSDIVNMTIERASKRSLGKAAIGAAIGGVLTGGIGAIAGAAIGGRKKDDSVIVLTVKYGPANVDLFFGGDDVSKKYGQFTALLR